MKWDLAELMKKALEENKKELNKIGFVPPPPVVIPIVDALISLGVSLGIGELLYDGFSLSSETTIEELISGLNIGDDKKDLLRAEVKRVTEKSEEFGYKITEEELAEHIADYIKDNPTMFLISPNKDFKVPNLDADKEFNLKSLLNEYYNEDTRREHQIHFIKLRSEYGGKPSRYIYLGFQTKEEAQEYFEKFWDNSSKSLVTIRNMPLRSESSKAEIKAAINCEAGDVINVFEYDGTEKKYDFEIPNPKKNMIAYCTSTDKLVDNFSIYC